MSERDSQLSVPGLVINTEEVDAKLITIHIRGQAHFTGGDLDTIQRHFSKPLEELSAAEMAIATAYVYLRRAQVEDASWELARDGVALEGFEAMDPTAAASSATSSSSADTGAAPPETSTD